MGEGRDRVSGFTVIHDNVTKKPFLSQQLFFEEGDKTSTLLGLVHNMHCGK